MKLLLPLLSLIPFALAHHSVWSKRGHAEHARHLSRSLLDADIDVSASIGAFTKSSKTANDTGASKPKHVDIVVSEGVANPDGGKERWVSQVLTCSGRAVTWEWSLPVGRLFD